MTSVISTMPAMYHLDSFSIRSSCSGWYAIDLFSWFSTWLPGGHWMPLWNRLSAYSYSAGVRADFIHLFWVWAPWKISWPLLPAQGHCYTCRLQEASINQPSPEISVNCVIWNVQLSSSCPSSWEPQVHITAWPGTDFSFVRWEEMPWWCMY